MKIKQDTSENVLLHSFTLCSDQAIVIVIDYCCNKLIPHMMCPMG